MAFGGCCGHDHDCEEEDCAPQWVLFKYIDTSQVSCLNEEAEGSCRNVFKPWDERTIPTELPLRSNDDDPELLLYIPFTGDVKLSSICVVGADGKTPKKMRAFINRHDLDFSSVEGLAPVQEWDVLENGRGFIEYPTKVSKFINVHSLTLHFQECLDGSEQSEVHFIGLKGEFKETKREAVNAVYEAQAMPEDHKARGESRGNHFIN